MPTQLSINNYYYRRGGAETVFLEQNRLLEESGWRVVPFSMQHPQNLPSEWSAHFIDEIEFGGAYTTLGKVRRAVKVVYSLEARAKLGRLLDVVSPDVCHAHNIYHHISPSILGLLKSRGVPVVMTLHDLKIACPAYNMLAHDGICERCKGGRLGNVVIQRCIKDSALLSSVVMIEAWLHRAIGSYQDCVSRFLVPSRFYVEKLAEWGAPRERMVHMPNFVDPAAYEARFEPGRSFVYFGRVSKEKGVATLVRAASLARASLRIVGTGPQLEEIRQLTERLGANVEFAGYLTGARLHEAVSAARAVILPSEWYENAPMSVLEAYALGKPVIGAAIGGIPELVQTGVTGTTFPSGDAEALAAEMRRLVDAPDERIARMGRDAREWVLREFTARSYLARLVGVYRDLGIEGANRA